MCFAYTKARQHTAVSIYHMGIIDVLFLWPQVANYLPGGRNKRSRVGSVMMLVDV